jgi:single-stranded-DNA-specific exonuclease
LGIQANGRLRGLEMSPKPDLEGLLSKAAEASELLKDRASHGSKILLLSHYDADGLAAVGIMGSSLARIKAKFQLRVIKELDPGTLEEGLRSEPDLLLLTDIGSGYLESLTKTAEEHDIVVIDHHPPTGKTTGKMLQVNPHEFGLDGATEISAAGVAYLVARKMSASNSDLSTLAVVGALGDMQDKNDERRLRGPNEIAVQDGVRCGCLKTDKDLLFFGRETRPIHRALALTTTPFLPYLSGEEDHCAALLASHKIPLKIGERWRTTSDLSREEKQTLLSAIVELLVSKGFKGSKALELIGTVYTITNEPAGSLTRDAREFSSMLNACGRMDREGLAVSICLGERGAVLDEVQEVVAGYRKTLAGYMEWLAGTPSAIMDLKTVCVVRGEDKIAESMTGALSSILSSAGHLRPNKVTIVSARSRDGGIKLSARAPDAMLKKGVNLGLALQKASAALGGFGGGHDVAAGAHIRSTNGEELYNMIDSLILEQMKKE